MDDKAKLTSILLNLVKIPSENIYTGMPDHDNPDDPIEKQVAEQLLDQIF
jgi:hypothetical protein